VTRNSAEERDGNHYVKNVVEAALLAAERPLEVEQLRELFEEFERPLLPRSS
jgi:chromosome segregation and condensation protein ScpB